MEQKKWWKEAVIYQLYPKSFKDTNGDGIGDLNGIIEKLPYLQTLGITAIWLCPMFKSPMVDNGYDISDYRAIQPDFGSMADFDRLIEQANACGIEIIIDLVVNHTSDQHPWFIEALENPASPYRDYYIFKQSADGNPPNNWRSIFGGSVWESVPNEPNCYYFHTFSVHQPDLNWENPTLRAEIFELVNWWLDKGIAGFRVDAITFIKKAQDYQSLPADGADGLASVKHKSRNQKGIELFLAELNQKTFHQYQCVTVGEAPGVTYDEYAEFIGENGYFNMVFDFSYADIDVKSGSDWFKTNHWNVVELNAKIRKSQLAVQAVGWGANFLENHDQPRSLNKYIQDPNYQNAIGAKALAMLFFCLRGTPFIYQGQELGMANAKRSDLTEFNDISSIDNYQRAILEGFSPEVALAVINNRSRDNARTPFQWDTTQNAGFSSAETLWLKCAEEPIQTNAKAQLADPDSVFHFYRQLIALRQQSIYRETLIYGLFEPIETPDSVIAYQRIGDRKLACYVNLSSQSQAVVIEQSELLLSNLPITTPLDKGELVLAPYQAVLLTML